MIVVDASAMVEALVGRAVAPGLLDSLVGEVHAPHLLDIEVFSTLRGLVLGDKLTLAAADDARRDYVDLGIIRHSAAPFAERIWQLRHRLTSHDASYVALAEGLGAPLVTCDRTLDTEAHDAEVRVFASFE